MKRRLLTAVFAAFALGVAGCSSDDDVVIQQEDEKGAFEELGESIDETKEAAEDLKKKAEETAEDAKKATDGGGE